MNPNCLREYNQFRYYNILTQYMLNILKHLNFESKFNYSIQGNFNILSLIDQNFVIDIAENIKNNQNLCWIFELLYLNDLNIICDTQRDLIKLTKIISTLFHQDSLSSIDELLGPRDFYNQINLLRLKIIKPSQIQIPFRFIGEYLKNMFILKNKKSMDNYNYFFTLKSIEIDPLDNIEKFYQPGEKLDFIFKIINKIDGSSYFIKLFTFTVSKPQFEIINSRVFKSTSLLNKFFLN